MASALFLHRHGSVQVNGCHQQSFPGAKLAQRCSRVALHLYQSAKLPLLAVRMTQYLAISNLRLVLKWSKDLTNNSCKTHLVSELIVRFPVVAGASTVWDV